MPSLIITTYWQAKNQSFVDKPIKFERIYDCLKDLLALEYRYAVEDEDTEGPPPDESAEDFSGRVLPRDLYQALKTAVDAFNLTDSMQIITEIEQRDARNADLAAYLRSHAEKFQMDHLQRTLASIAHE